MQIELINRITTITRYLTPRYATDEHVSFAAVLCVTFEDWLARSGRDERALLTTIREFVTRTAYDHEAEDIENLAGDFEFCQSYRGAENVCSEDRAVLALERLRAENGQARRCPRTVQRARNDRAG